MTEPSWSLPDHQSLHQSLDSAAPVGVPAAPSPAFPASRDPFDVDYVEQAELAPGQRWSTWGDFSITGRGPEPRPDWVITADGAIDTELGILKTGKEAD